MYVIVISSDGRHGNTAVLFVRVGAGGEWTHYRDHHQLFAASRVS